MTIKGYLDLNDFDLNLTQKDLDIFLKTKRAKSLIKKAHDEKHIIDIAIKENIIVDTQKENHCYEGSLISSFLRFHLQEKKESFCFETVMSHDSKIEEVKEAKQKSYKTYLYFICIDDPQTNVSRVKNRFEKGGHDVCPDKILNRYEKVLKNLFHMIEVTDKCYLFDNSGEKFQLIAEINKKENWK